MHSLLCGLTKLEEQESLFKCTGVNENEIGMSLYCFLIKVEHLS